VKSVKKLKIGSLLIPTSSFHWLYSANPTHSQVIHRHGRPLYVYLGNVIDYDDVPTLYMYILTPDCEIYLTDAENFEEL
jgi:hypothetical protein